MIAEFAEWSRFCKLCKLLCADVKREFGHLSDKSDTDRGRFSAVQVVRSLDLKIPDSQESGHKPGQSVQIIAPLEKPFGITNIATMCMFKSRKKKGTRYLPAGELLKNS